MPGWTTKASHHPCVQYRDHISVIKRVGQVPSWQSRFRWSARLGPVREAAAADLVRKVSYAVVQFPSALISGPEISSNRTVPL